MSRIDDLVQGFNPKGVEFKHLWELTSWDKKFNAVDQSKQPRVLKYNYLLASDLRPLIVEGGDVKLLTTNTSDLWTTAELARGLQSNGEVVAIPWGGNANVQHYAGKFLTADNRIAVINDPHVLDTKFLYYFMQSNLDLLGSFYRGSGIKHPSMAQVLDMKIPVPPIEVQREIVSILDKFTELEAELEAELKARKKQFKHHRGVLFKLESSHELPLAQICTRISSGGTPSRSRQEFFEGPIPWVRTQEVNFDEIWKTELCISEDAMASSSAKWVPKNTVIVAMYGATAAKVAIAKIPLTTNQACANLEVNSQIANYRYVFHYLMNSYENLKSLGQGTQSNLSLQQIKLYPIKLPPIETQNQIAEHLDTLFELSNSESGGIPAELTARRKQYEYYRNKLLTFKELETA